MAVTLALQSHAGLSPTYNPLDEGLIAYFPFDGDPLDHSGNGNTSNVQGPAFTADRFGQADSAYEFDGVDDRILVEIAQIPVGSSDRTLSLWAKTKPSDRGLEGLVEWGNEQDGRTFGIMAQFTPLRYLAKSYGSSLQDLESGQLADDVWRHLVATFKGGIMSIYVDGVLRGSKGVSINTGFTSVKIGVGVEGFTYFGGCLDEIRIYNRALSSYEVAQLYAAELDPPQITQQPQAITVALNETATFTVTATNHGLTYQWRKEGLSIPGATNSNYTITNAQPQHIGLYSVLVRNGPTGVLSSNAALNISGFDFGVWSSLVAWHPFNGNANDKSGFSNHGNPVGAILTTDRFGSSNHAYSFDGTSANYVELPDTDVFKSQDYTISLWFKPNRWPSGQDTAEFLISKGQNNFEIHLGSHIVGPSGIRFLPRIYAPSQGDFWDAPTGSFRTNVWQHLVAVFAPSVNEVRMFVDGTQLSLAGANQVLAGADLAGNARLGTRMGHPSLVGSNPFKGCLDDVRIYNRALTLQEVEALYATENTSPFPHRALARAIIENGALLVAPLTDFGNGYVTNPIVRVLGGGGTGARIVANIAYGKVFELIILHSGSGYASAPQILIESPPGEPSLSIRVSRVNVIQQVRVNHSYLLESSFHLQNWLPTGSPFIAETEKLTNEFIVEETGKFFRLREVANPEASP